MAAHIAAGQGGGIEGRCSGLAVIGPQEGHFARSNPEAVLPGAAIGMVVVSQGAGFCAQVAGGAGPRDAHQGIVLGMGPRHIRERRPPREAGMTGCAAGQGEGGGGLVAGAAERRRGGGARPGHSMAGGAGTVVASQGNGGVAHPQEGHGMRRGDLTVAQGVVVATRSRAGRCGRGRMPGGVGQGSGVVTLSAHGGVAGVHSGVVASSGIMPGLGWMRRRHAVTVGAGP